MIEQEIIEGQRDILFLEAIIKEKVWGTERWVISAHPNGDCKIRSGEFQGKYLSSLWKEHPELFGPSGGDEFPLLVKIIDAREDLSIQVHPDDAYAKAHEQGSRGKSECWYVLDCRENGSIIVGTKAKDKGEAVRLIREGRYSELIREIPIQPGDFFRIDPGCLHAIKGGTRILEVQQSSDITYRVYDYGRKVDGKLRELHVEQSIDVITAPYIEETGSYETENLGGAEKTCYINGPHFAVERYRVEREVQVKSENTFLLVNVLRGEGWVNNVPIKKDDHFLIPCGMGTCHIRGNLEMIIGQPLDCAEHIDPAVRGN